VDKRPGTTAYRPVLTNITIETKGLRSPRSDLLTCYEVNGAVRRLSLPFIQVLPRRRLFYEYTVAFLRRPRVPDKTSNYEDNVFIFPIISNYANQTIYVFFIGF